MTTPPPEETFLTSTQVGALLGKSGRTVTRMADAGKIPIAVTLPGPNGAKLYRRTDIEALAVESDSPTPSAG